MLYCRCNWQCCWVRVVVCTTVGHDSNAMTTSQVLALIYLIIMKYLVNYWQDVIHLCKAQVIAWEDCTYEAMRKAPDIHGPLVLARTA
jgi:hypothetical protein